MKKIGMAGLVLALGLVAAMPAAADEQGLTTITAGHTESILDYIGGQTGLGGFSEIGNPGTWALTGGSALFIPVAKWAAYHDHFGFAALGSPINPEPPTTINGTHVYSASDNGFLTGSHGPPGDPFVPDQTNMTTPDDWSHGIVTLNLAEASGAFRFGLDNNQGDIWSSVASENSDGFAHMKAFSTNVFGTYVLAWEDLPNGGDKDWNDLVLVVSGIRPVPEPGTLALLGTGALGLFGYLRRRKA